MKRNHTIYSFYSVVQEKSTPGKPLGRKREKSASPCEALSVLKTRDAGTLNLVMN
jgi:hypothetical protein